MTELDWAILEKVKLVLDLIRVLQRMFGREWYVSGSLVISLRKDLRHQLKEAIEFCVPDFDVVVEEQRPDIERDAKAALRPCLEALKTGIEDRQGDGKDVTRVHEGPRRQPQGFTVAQMLATAIDPGLYEHIHRVPLCDHDNMRSLFEKTVADLVIKNAINLNAVKGLQACGCASSCTASCNCRYRCVKGVWNRTGGTSHVRAVCIEQVFQSPHRDKLRKWRIACAKRLLLR